MTKIAETYTMTLENGETLRLEKDEYSFLLICTDVDNETNSICFTSEEEVKSLVKMLQKSLLP